MAKKPAKDAKKRKGATPSPRTTEEDAVLGSALIGVHASFNIPSDVASFTELVIEWGCLGLSEEPDTISDASGNSHLLDAKRPPYTDEEGLHVFFDPPLSGGGQYGFHFLFGYNDAVHARTAAPKTDEELAKEASDRAAKAEA